MAAYDEIADWYEEEFLAGQRGRDPLGIDRAIGDLLGAGSGVCLEIGCGTGAHATRVRELGWTPVARADAGRLPLRDNSVPAVVVLKPGYLDGRWTKESWTDQGIRDKVGASHSPLPALLNAFLDAGLTPRRFTEGGTPLPLVLGVATTTPPDTHRTPLP